MKKGTKEIRKKRVGSVVRLVGIRFLCDGARKEDPEDESRDTTFIPGRVVLVHHALRSYSVGMLARTYADVRKRTRQTSDRIDAEQRG